MNANMVRGFSSGHLNVRSLLPKLHEVHMLLEEHGFDLFTVTETWLGPDISDDDIQIDGYRLYRHDRVGRGGGVCWYVRSGMRCERVEVDSAIEQLWVRVFFGGTTVSCGVIYRPPNCCPNQFLGSLEDTLSNVVLASDEVLCLGDLNIDMLKLDFPMTVQLLQTLEIYGLQQYITQPTRVTERSSTLIDVVL